MLKSVGSTSRVPSDLPLTYLPCSSLLTTSLGCHFSSRQNGSTAQMRLTNGPLLQRKLCDISHLPTGLCSHLGTRIQPQMCLGI